MPPYTPTGEQRAILAHDRHRHARVLAGPGTGKSATLVALVDKLLADDPTLRIKLLTFTRAATAELALKVSGHPAAATQRPSTVHSFSISVLLRNPNAGGFPQPLRLADDWENKIIVFPELARRTGVSVSKLKNLVKEMATNWEHLQQRNDPKVDPNDRPRFLGSWNEHRQIYGYTLLAELPYALLRTLQNHQDVDGINLHLLIVDEYQDLNACDLEVLRLIAQHGCVIIGAGDDDQSIYSMRSAAPEGIRNFLTDYPGATNYPLSITQRCGSRIIEWASYVIQGDPDRPVERPQLTAAAGSPEGEVALLAFDDEAREARGVAELIQYLVERKHVAAEEILVLLRGDYNGMFSKPIKQNLDELRIPYSDPDFVVRMLAEPSNRRFLETFRILVNRQDSLSWAALLRLKGGIGSEFFNYVYTHARTNGVQFGRALVDLHGTHFPNAPRSANKAHELVQSVTAWCEANPLPEGNPAEGWGHWMIERSGGDVVPRPSEEFVALLGALDTLAESEEEIGRYLSQITPLGRDYALAQCRGVRIMTMGNAKGLTVKATIVSGLEEGNVPRRDAGDSSEERRLLYVAMTRAKEYLFGTWARQREGPTARAGAQHAGALRQPCTFFDHGPVASQDGSTYLRDHRI